MSNRRDFLRSAFARWRQGLGICMRSESSIFRARAVQVIACFWFQLWTVKEDMASNAKDTLKMVSSYGYKQIESFEGREGMFWG
jgi:hypothetical protein